MLTIQRKGSALVSSHMYFKVNRGYNTEHSQHSENHSFKNSNLSYSTDAVQRCHIFILKVYLFVCKVIHWKQCSIEWVQDFLMTFVNRNWELRSCKCHTVAYTKLLFISIRNGFLQDLVNVQTWTPQLPSAHLNLYRVIKQRGAYFTAVKTGA